MLRPFKSAALLVRVRRSLRTVVALASAALLLSAAHAGAAEADLPANAAANGGFESDMAGWTRTDTAAATAWSSTTNPRSGTQAFNWWHDGSFNVTVSQTVTGLPDGKYALSGYTQGGGGEAVSRLFAETGGVKQTADFRNTGYLQWIETTIPVISISSDSSVTIGFEITGATGQWGSLDDLTLIRVGDLDAEPASIVSLQPVAVNTLIHEEARLPGVVTALYSDGSQSQLPVAWDEAEPEQVAAVGSFSIEGTVQGDTELRAQATVAVSYRSFDVNGDAVVDAGDLAIISYYMGVSPTELSEEATSSDFNNDGRLTTDDLALLMDKLLERE